eukprot:TRINITY_DN782_c0_g2_i1.p1 TRINITY_DN782_c0_g2~~TRINITY_DN782_c0_g2_i1.p1  ORF type:complete len:275 (+),score=58.51 TRINITY_DN782_c0_g2_i1:222-1046(+)
MAALAAADPALKVIKEHYPDAMQEEVFVRSVALELFKLGFSNKNCIALVNTCRDEICRPLAATIDQQFGLSFNLSGLGGIITSGKTGLLAAMSHSPQAPSQATGQPIQRYIFFAFPHTAVSETGGVGDIFRRGRDAISHACGALIAVQKHAQSGKPVEDDADDEELTKLKKKVLAKPDAAVKGDGPTLIDVTKAAHEVISEELEHLVSITAHPDTSDYAVITGVQIHSGNQLPDQPFKAERLVDYVSPGTMYAVVNKEKYILSVEGDRIVSHKQ